MKRSHGVNLISDALPCGRLWYLETRQAIGYADFRSRSHDAVIRVYDAAGNVIETHERVRIRSNRSAILLVRAPGRLLVLDSFTD